MRQSVEEAMAFKQMLHHSAPTLYMALCTDESGQSTVREYHGSLTTHRKVLLKLNVEGFNIFMSTNTLSGKTRKSDEVTKVNAFFIDYDVGDWSADDQKAFLKKFPGRPHMVVETSPGCFHVYWLVKDAPLEKFKEVQQRLAAKFNSDPKVCDLPRVMRVPGTINWKRKKPFLAKIVFKADNPKPIPFRLFARKMFGDEAPQSSSAGSEATAVAALPNSVDGDGLVQRVMEALQIIPADDT